MLPQYNSLKSFWNLASSTDSRIRLKTSRAGSLLHKGILFELKQPKQINSYFLRFSGFFQSSEKKCNSCQDIRAVFLLCQFNVIFKSPKTKRKDFAF